MSRRATRRIDERISELQRDFRQATEEVEDLFVSSAEAERRVDDRGNNVPSDDDFDEEAAAYD